MILLSVCMYAVSSSEVCVHMEAGSVVSSSDECGKLVV